MSRISLIGLPVVGVGLLLGTACDLDQSFLFPDPIEGVPGIVDLGQLTPVALNNSADVLDQVIFGEIGPTGTAELGGATFEFEGTDGSVCVWVDSELVHWNQSVSPSDQVPEWSQPDNPFDDGDLELSGGLSVYYTGTPGEQIGDFQVRYEDSLGNIVPIELIEESAEFLGEWAFWGQRRAAVVQPFSEVEALA